MPVDPIAICGVGNMLNVLVGFLVGKILGKKTTMGVANSESSSIEREVKNDSRV